MKKRGLIAALALALLFTPASLKAQNVEQNNAGQKIIRQTKEISSYIEQNKQDPYDFVIDAFSSHQIVLLGERHDYSNHRVFTSNLIKKLEGKVNCVALEINSGFQEQLDSYLLNGDEKYLSKIRNSPYVTIMINKEYLDILRAIKSSKLDAICIDNSESGIEERDKGMARNIQDYLKKDKDAKILVYAGGLHIRKNQKWIMTSIYVPLVNSGFSKEKLFSVSQESDSVFNSLNVLVNGLDKPIAVKIGGPLNNLIYGVGFFNTAYGETFDAVILYPNNK